MAGERGAGKTYSQWFWEGVEIPPSRDSVVCWKWKRCGTPRGYGLFKRKYSHRVAYELEHGPIGEGLVVCHTCDTPSCCNPYHLFLGTQQDNMNDAKKKMRARGTKPKLNAEQVRELRTLAATGTPYDDLEIRFNLNRCSLHDAVTRKTYRWVT